MDRQTALETIDAALEAVQSLRQAKDEDKSLIAEIGAWLLLREVNRLIEMLEAGKDNTDERVLHP